MFKSGLDTVKSSMARSHDPTTLNPCPANTTDLRQRILQSSRLLLDCKGVARLSIRQVMAAFADAMLGAGREDPTTPGTLAAPAESTLSKGE